MKQIEPKIATLMDHLGDMLDEIKLIPPEHRSQRLLDALDGIMHCSRGIDKELNTRDMICQRLTHQMNNLSLLLNQAVPRTPLEPSRN